MEIRSTKATSILLMGKDLSCSLPLFSFSGKGLQMLRSETVLSFRRTLAFLSHLRVKGLVEALGFQHAAGGAVPDLCKARRVVLVALAWTILSHLVWARQGFGWEPALAHVASQARGLKLSLSSGLRTFTVRDIASGRQRLHNRMELKARKTALHRETGLEHLLAN